MNSFLGNIYIVIPIKKCNDNMTEDIMDKFDSMPFIALIHHISKNKLKYSMKNPNHVYMVHEGRYLMEIQKRKNLSQDDLASIFGQSKGTIAKALRKLEDKGYVKRETDENNRRKYILNTTKEGEKLAILLNKELTEWEANVGINNLDENTKEQLRQIARRSEEILKEDD